MKILAMDTSAKVTSVAVSSENKILAEFNIDTQLTHSQALMPMVEAALSVAAIDLKDIDCFAITTGPGSFTGLRIGMGAIKGLAFALNKPCVSVSTLHALALNLSGVDGIVCAVMDARCNQVYTAIFDSDGDKVTRLCEDKAVTIDELLELLKLYEKRIFFVGDGYDLCYNKVNGSGTLNVKPTYYANRFQKAANVCHIGAGEFLKGNVISADLLVPMYLRMPQAERELKLKKEVSKHS